MNEPETGVLVALRDLLGERLREEKYGDTSIADVLDMVDIEVGFGMDSRGNRTTLLVVEGDWSERYQRQIPDVSYVEMNGERYMIPRPKEVDFDFLSEDSVKVARARFLLLRDYYYKRWRSVSHPMRQEAVAKFFGGSVWTPAEGSELAKAMGIE